MLNMNTFSHTMAANYIIDPIKYVCLDYKLNKDASDVCMMGNIYNCVQTQNFVYKCKHIIFAPMYNAQGGLTIRVYLAVNIPKSKLGKLEQDYMVSNGQLMSYLVSDKTFSSAMPLSAHPNNIMQKMRLGY